MKHHVKFIFSQFMTIMSFYKKNALFACSLDGGYPDFNIDVTSTAFALIMNKLRTSYDISGDYPTILNTVTPYKEPPVTVTPVYSLSEQAKQTIFCQKSQLS